MVRGRGGGDGSRRSEDMSMRRGDMMGKSRELIHTIRLHMYNETLRWIHTKDHPRAVSGHTAPKSHHVPLQPINGLKVLDLPRPREGGWSSSRCFCRLWDGERGSEVEEKDGPVRGARGVSGAVLWEELYSG